MRFLLLFVLLSAACNTDPVRPGEDGGSTLPDAALPPPDAEPDETGITDVGHAEDADGSDRPDLSGTEDTGIASCGDGDVDHSVNRATGWFVEECDDGSQNGVGLGACGADCRYRRCSEGRACGPLRSTFAAYMPSDDESIRQSYLQMRADGYEEVIFVNVGGQEWTKTGDQWAPGGEQIGFVDRSGGASALQRHLAVAEQAGIRVVVGLGGIIPLGGYGWEIWLSSDVRGPFVAWNLDLASELIDQVGDSAAFGGFYISQEVNFGSANQCEAAGSYYADMISGAQGRQGLRALVGAREISIAPYLAVGSQAASTTGTALRCLYDRLQAAGGIDRILVQDGVPKQAEGFTTMQNVGAHFQAMWEALPTNDRDTLWVDLETYAWPDGECFLSRPADIDRVAGQVRETGRWVGGFSQWIHAHNFTAAGLGQDECDPAREALGDTYVEHPFPFHAFVYQSNVIVRGYYLLPGGTAGLSCDTASGTQTWTYTEGDGLSVVHAPDYVSDDDVPDPREIFEVSFPHPGECTGNRIAWYVNPDGTTSAQVRF